MILTAGLWDVYPIQVMEYHIIPGMSLLEANLTDGQLLATSLGQPLKVHHP